VFADFSGTSARVLVIEVSARDIEPPLVFNFEVDDEGVASGLLRLPTGSDRTIVARAFNADGIETHRGGAEVDVLPGPNPTVFITLFPFAGELPVEVRLESIVITVEPASAVIDLGETVQLTATITDSEGNEIDEDVAWATLDPEVATVTVGGLVMAVGFGTTDVVAVFGGVGGASRITVLPEGPIAADLLGLYWIDEAPSGQGPAALGDDAPDPLDVPIHYSDGIFWTERDGNRGLRSEDLFQRGGAHAPAEGSKYSQHLDGAEKATFVVVASIIEGKSSHSRVAGFDFGIAHKSNSAAMLAVNDDGEIRFRFTAEEQGGNVIIRWPTDYRDNTRHVFHLVYDATEPDEEARVRLYVDGELKGGGEPVRRDWPGRDEGLDFGGEGLRLSVLNRDDGNRALNGSVYYYAVYTGVLTDDEIATDAAALLDRDDDD
jgi:hypothetical protein